MKRTADYLVETVISGFRHPDDGALRRSWNPTVIQHLIRQGMRIGYDMARLGHEVDFSSLPSSEERER